MARSLYRAILFAMANLIHAAAPAIGQTKTPAATPTTMPVTVTLRCRLLLPWLVLICLGALGCARTADRPDNVVLIVVDTLRQDHLSCYSGPGGPAQTPNIDALARSGVLLRHAYSHIPITGPSHATLFTSKLPAEHGFTNNGKILAAEQTTLAERLAAVGKKTAAFTSLGTVKGKLGFSQGFAEYADLREVWFCTAPEITGQVLPWLDRVAAAATPFFLWVHLSDPHEPYAPPGLDYPQVKVEVRGETVATVTAAGRLLSIPVELPPGPTEVRFSPAGAPPAGRLQLRDIRVPKIPCTITAGQGIDNREGWDGESVLYTSLPATLVLTNTGPEITTGKLKLLLSERLRRLEIQRRYALEVELVDRELGHLLRRLEELGLRQRSLVILTADHGESLGEHGYVGHVSQLYEPLLQIPLLLAGPGIPAGHELTTPVSLLDVCPTVLDLLGMDLPGELRGRSLVPLLHGGTLPATDLIAETYRPQAYRDRQALLRYPFKYLINQGINAPELYQVATDPDELHNLVSEQPALARDLRQALLQQLATVRGAAATDAELSDEDLAGLRALGYTQ